MKSLQFNNVCGLMDCDQPMSNYISPNNTVAFSSVCYSLFFSFIALKPFLVK